MPISMLMILDKLPNRVMEDEKAFTEKNSDIQDVVLLDSPIPEYKDQTLYILQAATSLPAFTDHLPLNLLFVQDSLTVFTGGAVASQRIPVLAGNIDAQKLIADIKDVIIYFRGIFDHLLSVVSSDTPLQTLTNVIASCFTNPVAIYDSSFKLLAHSQNFTMQDKLWADCDEKGYPEFDGSMAAIAQDHFKRIKQSTSAFIYNVAGLNYRIASKKIIQHNKFIGFYQVIEYNHPLSHGVLDLMEVISAYISIALMKHDLIHFNNGLMNGQFIVDLLEKKIDNPQTLMERRKNLGFLSANYVFLLAIKPSSHYLVDVQLSTICNQINTLLPFSNCLVYNDGIVVLINKYSNFPYSDEVENRLLAILKQYDLRCGLSQSSTNLLDAANLYKQSLQAIKLGMFIHPGCYIYDYSNFVLYDFIDSCLQSDNIRSYYHPAIAVLRNYDTKNQTCLVDTLQNYMNNHNNQIRTAKLLRIHRSTLLYRIQKIEELTKIDLHNSDTIFHLQLTFKLLEYEKYFNAQPE